MEKILYTGGPILTMDRQAPRAEAVLVRDGILEAVGSLDAVKPLAAGARRVDLEGRTLMPAFIDGHSHLMSEGLASLKCDLTDCADLEELLGRIRTYREKNGLTHGEALICRGYDPTGMRENRQPDRSVLDRLGFDNPVVCVHRSGHMRTCNSAALRACGLDDGYVCPENGRAGRDEEGHLTGYFEEEACAPLKQLDTVTHAQRVKGILAAQEEYFRNGITTVQDGSYNKPKQLKAFAEAVRSGALKADTVLYLDPLAGEEFWKETEAAFGKRVYRDHLKIGGVKIFLDGSPQARTAWMQEPYEGTPDYRGYPIFPDEEVRSIVLASVRNGWQVLAHCNGDAAAKQFVDAVEAAAAVQPAVRQLRCVMVHAQTVKDEELVRMKALGMMASFFVGHCWYWGDTHLKNFGPQRGSRISPVRKAVEIGLPYDFHQDCPVTKPDMLHSVWCAVNRITRSGAVVGPENRIRAEDALWGATAGGAWSYFEENTKGVLKPGAAADLILLDRDPLASDPLTIRDIRVLETVKDGRTVFRA